MIATRTARRAEQKRRESTLSQGFRRGQEIGPRLGKVQERRDERISKGI
jgi:hypothetical protein